MSPVMMETFGRDSPELSAAWSAFSRWLAQYPRLKYIDLKRLAREVKDVPVEYLALVLAKVADCGLLRQVYRVKTPDGDLLEQDFDSPLDIPQEMPDRLQQGRSFKTDDGDIVTGFVFSTSPTNP